LQKGLCGAVGLNDYSRVALFYGTLRLVKNIVPELTAAKLKKDSSLFTSRFVRRNFQGTIFMLSKLEYQRISELSLKQGAKL
jgi:hypothetical protein